MSFLTFDESRDVPYYDNNPRISKMGWVALLFFTLLGFFLYGVIGIYSLLAGSIVFCFTILIPLLYFSNWDYSLIFHKPTRDEILLAVLMFVGYMIYAIVLDFILVSVGLTYQGEAASEVVDLITFVSLLFSMMGEELLKFIPLMFLMRVVYKFSNSRNLSIAISSLIVLLCFGLIHYYPPEFTLVSVLLVQGLGSVFELYGYFRTKNLFVSYLSHLLTDAFIFGLVFLGVS